MAPPPLTHKKPIYDTDKSSVSANDGKHCATAIQTAVPTRVLVKMDIPNVLGVMEQHCGIIAGKLSKITKPQGMSNQLFTSTVGLCEIIRNHTKQDEAVTHSVIDFASYEIEMITSFDRKIFRLVSNYGDIISILIARFTDVMSEMFAEEPNLENSVLSQRMEYNIRYSLLIEASAAVLEIEPFRDEAMIRAWCGIVGNDIAAWVLNLLQYAAKIEGETL